MWTIPLTMESAKRMKEPPRKRDRRNSGPPRKACLPLTCARAHLIQEFKADHTLQLQLLPNHSEWLHALFEHVHVQDVRVGFDDVCRWTEIHSWIVEFSELDFQARLRTPGLIRRSCSRDSTPSESDSTPPAPAPATSNTFDGQGTAAISAPLNLHERIAMIDKSMIIKTEPGSRPASVTVETWPPPPMDTNGSRSSDNEPPPEMLQGRSLAPEPAPPKVTSVPAGFPPNKKTFLTAAETQLELALQGIYLVELLRELNGQLDKFDDEAPLNTLVARYQKYVASNVLREPLTPPSSDSGVDDNGAENDKGTQTG